MSGLQPADIHAFPFAWEEGRPAIIWAWQPALRDRAAELQQSIGAHLKQWLASPAHASYAITAIQLETAAGFEPLMEQLEQVHKIAALRILLPPGELYSVYELKSKLGSPLAAQVCEAIESLSQLYRSKDYAGYAKTISLLEKEPRLELLLEDPAIWQQVQAFLACTIGIGMPLTGQPAPKEWCRALLAHGDHMLAAPRAHEEGVHKDLIQQVIAYIDQNYMYDIGMKQIAERFQMTPNYLSSLFHKKHGSTFIKYLTETRMLKAKELLASNPQLKVAEVAEAVGYYSARHFTKLFTEHFGCYPSEIRERIDN